MHLQAACFCVLTHHGHLVDVINTVLYMGNAFVPLLNECLIIADLPFELDGFLLLLLLLLLQQSCLLTVLGLNITCSMPCCCKAVDLDLLNDADGMLAHIKTQTSQSLDCRVLPRC